VFSRDFGARGWEDGGGEEDGFDPYWGVLDDAKLGEADLTADAPWLAAQLAPLLGHHARKCGFLVALAAAGGVPLERVMRPGARTCRLHAMSSAALDRPLCREPVHDCWTAAGVHPACINHFDVQKQIHLFVA
jgi:hypothetical protein